MRPMFLLAWLAAWIGLCVSPVPAGAAEPVIATIAQGRVSGSRDGSISIFKGIPYGASTAGSNRFKPPVPPAKWSGVRDVLAYGPSAPQREPGAGRSASPLAVAAAQIVEAQRLLCRGVIVDERAATLVPGDQVLGLHLLQGLPHGADADTQLARQLDLVGKRDARPPGARFDTLNQTVPHLEVERSNGKAAPGLHGIPHWKFV